MTWSVTLMEELGQQGNGGNYITNSIVLSFLKINY